MSHPRIGITLTSNGRHTCAECGQRFNRDEETSAGKAPKYCSQHCGNEVSRRRTKTQIGVCLCGKPILDNEWATWPKMYCSADCPTRSNRTTKLPTDHPARWFGKSEPVEYFHCLGCQTYTARRRRGSRTARRCTDCTEHPRSAVFYHKCADCDRLYVSQSETSKYCSPGCKHRQGASNRRARKRNAYVAPINRTQIFERDKWRCQICGGSINRRAQVPHPKAPTIDHIIPLADGGTHEPSNAQAAHFQCNSIKGSNYAPNGDQLLLIG